MRVIEQFVASKTPNADECEDLIFVNPHFAAVIDGVTSKRERNNKGMSTGRKAATLLYQALETLPRTVDKEELFNALNAAIRSYYLSRNILQEAEIRSEFRCGASIVVYSDYHREVWRVGDCPIIIGMERVDARKAQDILLSELRACFLETELRRGKTIQELQVFDTSRAYLEEMLSRQIVFQNADEPSPYNFEVIDGFFKDPKKIETFPVPDPVEFLVLASDGYPLLKPTLDESEAYLSQILAEDPLCFRIFKSTKGLYKGNNSFDDRAYLRLSVQEDPQNKEALPLSM